jgi:hypothetical protein
MLSEAAEHESSSRFHPLLFLDRQMSLMRDVRHGENLSRSLVEAREWTILICGGNDHIDRYSFSK